jgi:hypothetical protein
MKSTHLKFISVLVAYSYLFYHQSSGINFLIFNVLLLIALAWEQPELLRTVLWRWVAAGSLFSATCIVFNGSELAWAAHLVSLLVLVGFSCQPQASFLIAALQALHSLITAPLRRFIQLFEKQTGVSEPTQPAFSNRLYTYALPALVTLGFLILYRSANANFAHTLSLIQLDFISWEWIGFMLGGFLLLFGVFYREILLELSLLDFALKDGLEKEDMDYSPANERLLKENARGSSLLWMLNGLLLLVNFNDLIYFATNTGIPAGSTYADYVHQGVYTLILTVVLAIGILLYYFRGDQHFFTKNRLLLTLAYAWIIQNGVLLLITACKNHWYVEEYGLTYKRIGVFVYLLLTLIGLVSTLYKLKDIRSGWYLIRRNAWAFYFVLVLSAALNWDLLIARYNLYQARTLDVSYLFTLSDSALPELYAIRKDPQFNLSDVQKMRLETRKETFLESTATQQWQSWTYETSRIRASLNQIP